MAHLVRIWLAVRPIRAEPAQRIRKSDTRSEAYPARIAAGNVARCKLHHATPRHRRLGRTFYRADASVSRTSAYYFFLFFLEKALRDPRGSGAWRAAYPPPSSSADSIASVPFHTAACPSSSKPYISLPATCGSSISLVIISLRSRFVRICTERSKE